MKKYLSIVLSFALCFSLCACGGNSASTESAASIDTSQAEETVSESGVDEVPVEETAASNPFEPLEPTYSICLPLYGMVKAIEGNDNETYSEHTYDEKGNLISWKEGGVTYTRTYTENGVVKEEICDSNATGYSRIYSYDENGNNTKITQTHVKQGLYIYEYTYNEQGLPESETWTNDDGNVEITTFEYEYDSLGRPVTVTEAVEGAISWIRTYTYDDLGNVKTANNTFVKYNDIQESTNEYDRFGRWIAFNIKNTSETVFEYAQVGEILLSTDGNTGLKTTDSWTELVVGSSIPSVESVLEGATLLETSDTTFAYKLDNGDMDVMLGHKNQRVTKWLDSKNLADTAEQTYRAYLAVLSQVLGYQVDEQEDGTTLVSDSGNTLMEITFDIVDGQCQMHIELLSLNFNNATDAAASNNSPDQVTLDTESNQDDTMTTIEFSEPVVIADNENFYVAATGKYYDQGAMEIGYNIEIENRCNQYVRFFVINGNLNGYDVSQDGPYFDSNFIAGGTNARTTLYFLVDLMSPSVVMNSLDDLVNLNGTLLIDYSDDSVVANNTEFVPFETVLP